MTHEPDFDALANTDPGTTTGRIAARRPAPEPEAGTGGASAPDTHLLDYVRVLHKRRWIAIPVFAAVVGATVLYTFTATPVYQGRAQLLIETENPNVVNFQEVIEEGQANRDYYETQYRILQSRAIVRKTIDALKLWDHPQFQSEEGYGFGGAASAEAPASDETTEQARVITTFLNDLRISPVRNSRLVDVVFDSPDPKLAGEVPNALSRAFIDQSLEFKFLASKEASDWLSERLAEQRKKVEESEAALQRYLERNDAIALEDRQNIVVQKLADLNAAVTKAKTDRIERESRYEQLREIQSNVAALDTFPAVLGNSFIQELKAELAEQQRQEAQLAEKLGDRHPDLMKARTAVKNSEARLRAEIAKVVESVRNEYQGALNQERSLVAALEAQKQEALALNRQGIDYGVLQRDAESNRQIYETLLQRTKETDISGELKTSNVRVVDMSEVPRAPVWPNKQLNLLLALLGGGILAVGLAFFAEYLDDRIKRPDEIETYLGLPSLGLVPALTEKAGKAQNPLLNNGVPANFSEAIRGVRTNLMFSVPDDGVRTLVVTSSGPGEGKTLIASNLAIALAQAGGRVLLIDADMRRPRQHEVFRQPQEPGLSNLIVAQATPKQVARATDVEGLWVVPAGKIPPNPAELLTSARFAEFVEKLNGYFDWVIIDSPPVLAVSDATVLAHTARRAVFVVGAEMTGRKAAQTSVDQLERAGASVLGAVLNRVDIQRHSYYYSQYYRREYADYYTSGAAN